ncbi:MAG: hypothetical protein HY067_16930 [Betaproteobacteria bacterium]|nr:hypothetical protein [Betaproteobacteria bacterium]
MHARLIDVIDQHDTEAEADRLAKKIAEKAKAEKAHLAGRVVGDIPALLANGASHYL